MKKGKKVLSLLLVLMMLFSVAGCQSQPTVEEPPAETDALYTPGTYTGKGAGINGEIEVEVTGQRMK